MRAERPRRELTVETLAQGGDGIARDHGKVVFVPFALPGERVRVELVSSGKRFDRAHVLAILDAAPERIASRCPAFGECGGCRFQNVDYATEQRWKTRLVQEQCARIPGFTEARLEPLVPSPHEWHSRNRIQLHAVGGRVGFRRLRSNAIAETDVCPIADERLRVLLPVLRRPEVAALCSAGVAERRLEVRVGYEPDAPLSIDFDPPLATSQLEVLRALISDAVDRPVRLYGRDDASNIATWQVAGRECCATGGGFTQTNSAINDLLVQYVGEQVNAYGAGNTLVDFYCGAGNFALALATRFARVIGLDTPAAVHDARQNASRLKLDHCTFLEADLTQPDAAQLEAIVPPEAVAILDPPRKGAKRLVRFLALRLPRAIAYVSCDPPAFARDAGVLCEAGYTLRSVRPFDMFPKTAEIELVGIFTR